jgi:PAS domain S-box-containing protein
MTQQRTGSSGKVTGSPLGESAALSSGNGAGSAGVAQRAEALWAATRVIIGRGDFQAAAPDFLRAICGALGWDMAELWWRQAGDEHLSKVSEWLAESAANSAFPASGAPETLPPDEGLVGRVWQSRRAAWSTGLPEGILARRTEAAPESAVRTAFAFPISLRGEALGVIACYSLNVYAPDQNLIDTMESLGSLIGLLVERSDAEAALADSERRLRFAMEAGKLGAWEWDIPSGHVTWSDTLEQIHGVPSGSFGGTFEDYQKDIHPEDRDMVLENVRGALKTGALQMQYRIIRPDGEVRWLSSHGQVINNELGEPVQLAGVCQDVTDITLAHDHASRLAAIVESSDDAIISKDLKGVITSWNKGAEDLYGYTADEMIGQHVARLAAPGHEDQTSAILIRIAAGDRVDHFETRRQHKNGDIIDVSITASPIKDHAGNIVGVSAINRDIRESKKFEHRLLSHARQQRTIAELGQLALEEDDLQKVFDHAVGLVSETLEVEFTEVLELTLDDRLFLRAGSGWREGLVGAAFVPAGADSQAGNTLKTYIPVIVEDLREERRFSGPALLLDHGVISGVSCIIHGAGGKPWGVFGAHSNNKRIFTPDEVSFLRSVANVLGSAVSGAQADQLIQERERQLREERDTNVKLYALEQAARTRSQEHEQRQTLMAETSIAMAAASPDEAMMMAAAGRLTVPALADWCSIDLVTQDGNLTCAALIHDDPKKVEAALALRRRFPPALDSDTGIAGVIKSGRSGIITDVSDDLLEKAVPSEEARTALRAFGLTSGISAPITARGRILGAITLGMAESDRRFNRKDVTAIEELGRSVGLALDNARLVRDLEASIEAKDEFLGLMSHELRTPLTAIYGGARLLRARNNKLDENTRADLLRDIELESERLFRMIENLLAISRVELGQRVATEPVLVQRALEKIVRSHREKYPSRTIEMQVDDGLPAAAAQPTYLEQVVRNLLSNAEKYTPKDSAIRIVAASADHEVTVAVLDEGPGTTEDDAAMIFERFYRGDATSSSVSGLGLGLTVCKRLIEACRGRIWAEPGPQGGLAVSFTLPVYQEEDHS